MINKFEEILKELSVQLQIELHIDHNGACLIDFDEKIKVQLELDQSEENLIVFCSIAPITPGKFKENVFIDALKENDKFPYIATFAYLEKENSLVMFEYLYFPDLKADILASYISTFSEIALLYHDALIHGQIAPALKLI